MSKKISSIVIGALIMLPLISINTSAIMAATNGPLWVDTNHPQYFKDASGNSVYLTGAHCWWALMDDPARGYPFDYSSYLNYMVNNNQNFIRLWTWECSEGDGNGVLNPQKYMRGTSGTANDGGYKFDLSQPLNPAYFTQLQSRVSAARSKGIYVSVMLFSNWYGEYDYFNSSNNQQGIGNVSYNHKTVAEGNSQVIINYQQAYVRAAIDAIHGYDNVLYEIANEDAHNGGSVQWQYDMINYVKNYENSTYGVKHPVGMTDRAGAGASNLDLYNSPADWISIRDDLNNPIAWDGRVHKVSIWDTDHIGTFSPIIPDAAWKSFTRGHNPISMEHGSKGQYDSTTDLQYNHFGFFDSDRCLKDIKSYANRMNMAKVIPQNGGTSPADSGYCLYTSGSTYLAYQPANSSLNFNGLINATYNYEVFNPATSSVTATGSFRGTSTSFSTPGYYPFVVYIYARLTRRQNSMECRSYFSGQ